MTQQNYYEKLAKKMEKARDQYHISAMQIQKALFDDISTGRFRGQF